MGRQELQEWFDYDGEPGYFRLVTTNTSVLKTDIQTFLYILGKIKRHTAWLEDIILRLEEKLKFYAGWGVVEHSRDTFIFTQYLRKGEMENMTKEELESLTKGEMEG